MFTTTLGTGVTVTAMTVTAMTVTADARHALRFITANILSSDRRL